MGIGALIGAGIGEAAAGAGIAEGIGAGFAGAATFEGGAAALGGLGAAETFGGLGAAEAGLFGGEAAFAGAGLGAAEALGADAALTFGGSGFAGDVAEGAFAGSDLTGGAFDSFASSDSFAGSDLSAASFDQSGLSDVALSGSEFPQYQGEYPVSGDWSQATLNPADSSDIANLESGQFGEQQVAATPQTGDPVTEAMQGGPASEQAASSGGRAAAGNAAAGRAGGAGGFNPGSMLSSLMQLAQGKPSPPALGQGGQASQALLDQGNQLLANYNQGILSAPMMAQLQLSLQGNLNKIRQFYASAGRYNSTDRIQAENQAYLQATASMAQSLNQELTAGLKALGQAGSLFNQQAQIQLQADTSYRNSLNQALGSILKIPFSGGGQQTGLFNQSAPTEQQYADQQQYDYSGGGYGSDFSIGQEG